MDAQQLFANYWWVLVILFSLLFYKFILRVFFGMVIVPENRIGLVTKKFVLFGANNNVVFYNPTSNTWTQGPSLPATLGGERAL